MLRAYLINVGKQPITVPTVSRPEVPHSSFCSSELDARTSAYVFFVGADGYGRKIVESPVKYQPVTLQPGEMTELSYQSEEHESPPIKSSEDDAKWLKKFNDQMQNDRELLDYVVFEVPKELADHYGWWSGHLLILAMEGSKGQQEARGNAGKMPAFQSE